MIYTPLTKKAMRIAYEAHHGQVDKVGVPYIYHPIHLAEQMKEEYSTCAALLHDVVEDTAWTFEALEREGFPAAVIDALRLLTHDDAVPYMEYVAAIKRNPIAKAVKLADLSHNSDESRVDAPDDRMRARWEKYRQAICVLSEQE